MLTGYLPSKHNTLNQCRLILVHCLRNWANIKPSLVESLVFLLGFAIGLNSLPATISDIAPTLRIYRFNVTCLLDSCSVAYSCVLTLLPFDCHVDNIAVVYCRSVGNPLPPPPQSKAGVSDIFRYHQNWSLIGPGSLPTPGVAMLSLSTYSVKHSSVWNDVKEKMKWIGL